MACTWTGSSHTWQLTDTTVLLKLYWHPEFWSSFINKHSLFMQTEAVVHCQIQQQTITCCNAELSLSNHRYIATWTLDGKISGKIWKVIIWGPLFTPEKCGIYTGHNSTWGYTIVPCNVWYKTWKTPFLNKHFPNSMKKPARRCRYQTAVRHRASPRKVLHQAIFKTWQVCINKLLNKHSVCQWFEMQLCSCVIVMVV